MAACFSDLLVQLSDPHIGATWAEPDPVAGLRVAVEAVGALRPAPEAVIVTGDLADNQTDAEYELVRELLERVDAPHWVLPGNHDDRAALRRHFGLPGAGNEPVQYTADVGPLRVVMLDTSVPGEDYGSFDAERLAWLDTILSEAGDAPTLLAMHHPPILTGMPAMDAIGLPEADRLALGEVVARHSQVRRIVCGHIHRAIAGELAGRSVIVVPSTYVQMRLDFASDRIQLDPEEPTGYAIHALLEGELVSHIQPLE